jgi:hypothetical protein
VGGPFKIVSDVYTKELEAFHLLLCDPVDVDRGVLPLLYHDVHHPLLRFVDVDHSARALTSSL